MGGLDVLVYATGFDALALGFKVSGRRGIDLATKFGATAADKMQTTPPNACFMHA